MEEMKFAQAQQAVYPGAITNTPPKSKDSPFEAMHKGLSSINSRLERAASAINSIADHIAGPVSDDNPKAEISPSHYAGQFQSIDRAFLALETAIRRLEPSY